MSSGPGAGDTAADDTSVGDATVAEDATTVGDTAAGDATDVDPPGGRVCYRCDRSLDTDHWIRLSTQPAPGLTDDYGPVSHRYCPDCVAALGLLRIVSETPSVSRTGSN